MRPKDHPQVTRYAIGIAFMVVFSCDSFQEDFIQKENQIVFSQTEFYTTPGVPVEIDIKALVKQAFTNATLKVSQNPTKGQLTQPDEIILVYTPNENFFEGEDQFVISVLSNGQTLKTETITIFMTGSPWATYFGGSDYENGNSVAFDVFGNVYLAGSTVSTSGITFNGHQNSHGGGYLDAFLVKFNSNGVLQWATYYGGNESDHSYSLSVDAIGNVYLAGTTGSTSGIASNGHKNSFGGGQSDAFLVKFNANGQRQWATYYGSSGDELGYSTAVDSDGNVYLAGATQSTSGIASGGYQNTYGGSSYDAFLVKFNANGQRQWATYYGENRSEMGRSVAVDVSRNVYLAGVAGGDAFIVKFNRNGSRQWGAIYGGNGNNDQALSITTDDLGNVYLAGVTDSSSGIAEGGHQNIYGGGDWDVFLVKFNTSGARQWATYYGGVGSEWGNSVAVDLSGNVYLSGGTSSTSGIASSDYQDTYGGGGDAFLAKFSSNGERLWAKYYGSGSNEEGSSVSVDFFGSIYLAGSTTSESGIATGGHQNTYGGGWDAFLVKFISN